MAFPLTPVLDNFTGTNGDDLPVYSANWQATPTGGAPLEIQSNAATGTSAGGNNTNSWATSFGPDCEVYVTISTVAAAGNVILLFARGVQTGSLATVDGYVLRYAPAAGTDTLTIQSVTNGTQTSIGAAFSQEISNGDSIGLECVGTTLTCYYKPSGGAWGSLFSRTDSTYTSAGQIALFSTSTGVRFDAFGGGTIHQSTGALSGQGSSVVGSATNFTVHPASGALSGQGASIVGSANNFTVHTTSGTLSAQGASIVGSATNFTVHPSTGTLNGQGSAIAGSAERTTPSGSHDTSGALSAQGSSISGSANNFTIHATSGTMQGQGASIVGSAITYTVHPSSGILTGQGSSLSGVSVHTAAGTHSASGDLNGQGSTVSGVADHISVTPQTPTYLSAGGGGGGVDYDKERKKKQRVREMVEQALNEIDDAPVYVQETVKKEAVKYVEEQLEYNTIDETKIEHIIQLINDYQLKLIIKEHDDIATRILLLH